MLESGIGVPNPEELARIQKIEKEANVEKESAGDVDLSPSESNKKDDGFNAFKLDNLVSNMSKIVEKTTRKYFKSVDLL